MIDFLTDYGEAVEEQNELNKKMQKHAPPKRHR